MALILIPILLFLLGFGLVITFILRKTRGLEERNKRLSALQKIDQIMMSRVLTVKEAAQQLTDAISFELGFEIGVLALVDESKSTLKRVAMSNTKTGVKAKEVLPLPYENLEIPLSAEDNISIRAIKTNQRQVTNDLYDLFRPTLDPEISKKIQQTVEVKTSLVYPVRIKEKPIGVMIISVARRLNQLSSYELESIENLVDVLGIALDNALLYQNLETTTQELDAANKRLKELDLLKSEFVSVASHELRTPMTAIKSYLWMALDGRGGTITDKQKYYLERAYGSTDRLIKLVNDLLNVSRIESGKISMDMQKMDMGQFIDDVIAEIKPRADELKLSVVNAYDKQTPLPPVLADGDKIKEVIINLIGNSLKFTPAGGEIKIWFTRENDMIVTHVTDNGEGLAPEDIAKLFQKFGLVKASYVTNQMASQGTGLGLYISKSIVGLHHGTMWAQSGGKGQGVTFSFSLPVFTQEGFDDAQKHKGTTGLGIVHSTI